MKIGRQPLTDNILYFGDTKYVKLVNCSAYPEPIACFVQDKNLVYPFLLAWLNSVMDQRNENVIVNLFLRVWSNLEVQLIQFEAKHVFLAWSNVDLIDFFNAYVFEVQSHSSFLSFIVIVLEKCFAFKAADWGQYIKFKITGFCIRFNLRWLFDVKIGKKLHENPFYPLYL